MITRIKIAIVGSRVYTNNLRIKNFIYELKVKYKDEVEIVSGGQKEGADGYAKKYALELGMNYKEFPPAHYNWNVLDPQVNIRNHIIFQTIIREINK